MSENRRKLEGRFNCLYRTVQAENCIYCGVRATCHDHFVPISLVAILAETKILKQFKMLLVPSCGECNQMAGDAIFKTVAAKRRFIKTKISKKYERIISMPHWSGSDLEKMSWIMQEHIKSGLRMKRFISQRISYQNTSTSKRVIAKNYTEAACIFSGKNNGQEIKNKEGKRRFIKGRFRRIRNCIWCGSEIICRNERHIFCSPNCSGRYSGWRHGKLPSSRKDEAPYNYGKADFILHIPASEMARRGTINTEGDLGMGGE